MYKKVGIVVLAKVKPDDFVGTEFPLKAYFSSKNLNGIMMDQALRPASLASSDPLISPRDTVHL